MKWEQTIAFIKETVRDWTPVYELNVRGEGITVPQEVIHRCKGSKLSGLFSDHNIGSIQKTHGRYFLERDPRIFKLMLAHIKSNGNL